MKVETISKDKAKEAMSEWLHNSFEIKELQHDYKIMREALLNEFDRIESLYKGMSKKDYMIDINFGMFLYEYLNSIDNFSIRLASDDDFWRFLSVIVVPDIVAKRWPDFNENHFWKQSNRIWLKTLWWYIYLTWNGSRQSTLEMLSGFSFNTDMIQGLVERTGKKGTYINVYRLMILYYSKVDKNDIIKYKKRVSSKSDSLFRALMKLNTARCLVIDPCLCDGGEEGYVKSLFKDLNIKFS